MFKYGKYSYYAYPQISQVTLDDMGLGYIMQCTARNIAL